MTDLHFGPTRYFRPVCSRWATGYYGGPVGYQETKRPDTGHIELEPGQTMPLHKWRDYLDWREN